MQMRSENPFAVTRTIDPLVPLAQVRILWIQSMVETFGTSLGSGNGDGIELRLHLVCCLVCINCDPLTLCMEVGFPTQSFSLTELP